jgi:autotransporter-associated beta strand protein
VPALRLGKWIGVLAVVFGAMGQLNAQLYWRTDNSSATWTGSNWSNPASSTGGTAWSSGSNAIFSDNSTVTFATTTVGDVTVAAGKTVTVTAAGTLSNPAGSLVATYDIGDNATLTWSGQNVSSNSGAGFIKNGNGTWNRGSGGGGNYTGGFTLNAGTVSVTGQRGFGTAALTVNGGTINSSGSSTFSVNSIAIGGNFTFTGSGNDIYTADVSLGGATRTITNSSTGNRTFSGIISGSSGVGLIFNGTGNTTLSGANTYTGTTTINGGTLSLNSTNALQNSTLDTGASGSQAVNFIVAGTNTYNLGGLAGSDNLSLGANTISVGSNNQTTTYSGVISSSTGGLAKTGSGSLILTGANTYAGGTTVSEGTLRVNGTHASAITVSSGATLGGNGTVSGLVTLNSGANLTPGNSVGNLNLNGGLTLNSTSTLTMEIDGGSAFDTINVGSGSLTYAGTLSLVFGYTPAVNATYQLFTGTSVAGATGNFASLTFNNPEYQGTFNPTSGVLTLTAIPEPKTWALLALGALSLLWINRKKSPLRFPNHAASQAVTNPNPIIPQA